ncbi:MAG: WD40 repeat domain-containing protein [Microscillaceae bacterium]|nr:WD40 repeat domain-containing protein [Microscillaceae bacterium]
MKTNLPKVNKHRSEETESRFFDEQGHLNDSGCTLYVEARLLQREEELPLAITRHIESCPHCQQEILDFYEFMQDEDPANLEVHPVLIPSAKSLWIRRLVNYTSSLSRVAAVVLLTVVSCLAYLIVREPNGDEVKNLVSPFENENLQVRFHVWEMQGQEARTFTLPNGSLIHVSANTFADYNGLPVSGKIQLKYREFIHASDLIVSGIPMRINQIDGDHPLETAGMFEIKASKDGDPIFIAPGKFIEVNMASSWGAENFNNYYLDPHFTQEVALNTPLTTPALARMPEHQWKLIGKSEIIPTARLVRENAWLLQKRDMEIDSLALKIVQAQDEMLWNQQNQMTNPKSIPSTQSLYFTLSLNLEENPDMGKYQDVIWEYMGENEEESPSINNHWALNEKWDSLNLTPLKYKPLSLKGHSAAVNSAYFSPDGLYVVTASDDHSAKIWTNEARYLHTLKGHTDVVNSAVFSPTTGAYILTASDDHSAKIWSRQGNFITTLSGHHGAVKNAAFSANGDYILTTSTDHTARLWNARGQILYTLPHIRTNSPASFSSDNNYVLTIPTDSTAQVWSIKGDLIATLPGQFNSAAFSPDSKQIVTTSQKVSSGSAALWTVKGKLLKSFDLNDLAAKFTPNGQYLVSTTGNGSRLWYLNPAESYNTVLIRNLKNLPGKDRKGHEGHITHVDFSKYGDYIITASEDHTTKIWSENGWIQHTLREHTAGVNTAVFAPDGKSILTASDDHTAKIWIERKVGNIYELELIKNPKYFDARKPNALKLAGKKFYTVVRETNPEDIPEEKITQPNLEINPVVELEERYEKALASKHFLEKIQMTEKTVYLRKFKVKTLGIYGSNRIYKNNFPISCLSLLAIEGSPEYNSMKVFVISGQQQTAIQLLEYQQDSPIHIQFDPMYPSILLAVLPGDRVAYFSSKQNEDFSYSDLEYKQPFVFNLKYHQVITSKIELDLLTQDPEIVSQPNFKGWNF